MTTKKTIMVSAVMLTSIAYFVLSAQKNNRSICTFPCGEMGKRNIAPANNTDINDYNGISNNSMNTVFNSTLY